MQYDEIFVEVRQRVAAFKYWKEFNKDTFEWGKNENEYLDQVYRFLFTTACRTFMEFCAKKEGMALGEYCEMLGVKESDLIGG